MLKYASLTCVRHREQDVAVVLVVCVREVVVLEDNNVVDNGARIFMAEQCMMIPGWFDTNDSLDDEVPSIGSIALQVC